MRKIKTFCKHTILTILSSKSMSNSQKKLISKTLWHLTRTSPLCKLPRDFSPDIILIPNTSYINILNSFDYGALSVKKVYYINLTMKKSFATSIEIFIQYWILCQNEPINYVTKDFQFKIRPQSSNSHLIRIIFNAPPLSSVLCYYG